MHTTSITTRLTKDLEFEGVSRVADFNKEEIYVDEVFSEGFNNIFLGSKILSDVSDVNKWSTERFSAGVQFKEYWRSILSSLSGLQFADKKEAVNFFLHGVLCGHLRRIKLTGIDGYPYDEEDISAIKSECMFRYNDGILSHSFHLPRSVSRYSHQNFEGHRLLFNQFVRIGQTMFADEYRKYFTAHEPGDLFSKFLDSKWGLYEAGLPVSPEKQRMFIFALDSQVSDLRVAQSEIIFDQYRFNTLFDASNGCFWNLGDSNFRRRLDQTLEAKRDENCDFCEVKILGLVAWPEEALNTYIERQHV